jgi:hypothetical protein
MRSVICKSCVHSCKLMSILVLFRLLGCMECFRLFTKSAHLRCYKRTLSCEKHFKCSECFKSFTCPARLKRHMIIHIGEQPFGCSKCDCSALRIPGHSKTMGEYIIYRNQYDSRSIFGHSHGKTL